jgi:hypothetical protein
MDRTTRSKCTVLLIPKNYCEHGNYSLCNICKGNKVINAAIDSYNNSSKDVEYGVKNILENLLR